MYVDRNMLPATLLLSLVLALLILRGVFARGRTTV
jgi:hypothetical protein